jgi:hypothetical protein
VDTLDKEYLYSSINRLAEPSYSADGFFILFTEEVSPVSGGEPYGVQKIRFMSSDGTNVVSILDDGNANLHPSWVTPTQITFQWWSYGATPSSEFQIAFINLAGLGRIEMGVGEYPRTVYI